MALITTKGFADLLVIGNQSRPRIFDLEIRKPDLLFEHVEEIDERVVLVKPREGLLLQAAASQSQFVVGKSHEQLLVERPLDEQDVRARLHKIAALGFKSLAVLFLHSYTFDRHEQIVKRIAEEMG